MKHGIHRRCKIITAQAKGGPPPVGPTRRVLSIDADIALVHMVKEGVREKLAPERVVQTDIDVVITGLQAEHRLAREVEYRPIERPRYRAAAIDAIVGLMELIAEGRVGGEPGEVIEEIERVFDDIGIAFPHAVVVGIREPGRQHETAGVAAISGIDLAEKTNLSGRDGAQRDLVAGIPGVGVRHRGR